MEKVREKLSPIYKDFVAENIPQESSTISYEKLRGKLCQIMGPEFTEHEMITIARAFNASCYKERYNRDKIRALALTELKRFLWDDLQRLKEYFMQMDRKKCGTLPKKECYTILKGARLPFDNELIEKILEVAQKDADCEIFYEDILNFLDRNCNPMPDVPPINIKNEFWWGTEKQPVVGVLIDWCAFNKYLDLESTFKDIPGPNTVAALENKS